jgi:hypothetical protein
MREERPELAQVDAALERAVAVQPTDDTAVRPAEDPYLARLKRCWGDPGHAWAAFAGVMLLLLGTINLIEGLAAVGNPSFLASHQLYVVGSVTIWGSGHRHDAVGHVPLWGWIAVMIGGLELTLAFGVLVKDQFSRWAGVIALTLTSIVQLLMLPAYRVSSLSMLALELLAIYGLVARGKRLVDAGRHVSLTTCSVRGDVTEPAEPQSPPWQSWRCCAQKVTRSWNEWLAAVDGRDRVELYRRYVSALDDEEHAAAEIERAISLTPARQTRAPATSRLCAAAETPSADGEVVHSRRSADGLANPTRSSKAPAETGPGICWPMRRPPTT